MEDLWNEDKKCTICKGIFEKDSTPAGDCEMALRLPCSHFFGAECLGLLFLSKLEGGWEQKLCPSSSCRRKVYDEDEDAQETEVASGQRFGYRFIPRSETLYDYDPKMGH